MGRRLGEFTANNTKCMVEVNGVKLIDRMLVRLSELSLSKIVIVVGYEGDKLKEYISTRRGIDNILFIENKFYDKTNNIYSLWLAEKEFRKEDTLLLESDIIFDDNLIKELVEYPSPDCALVSKYERWMDGTMVSLDNNNSISAFVNKSDFRYADVKSYYKTVNIYKFSKEFINSHYMPFLEAYLKSHGENEYYEQVLSILVKAGSPSIKGLKVSSARWYEIDDVQDLRIAEARFASADEKLSKLMRSYGGYWRYEGLLDYCYLVNPYFPPEKMVDELKANFDVLLRDYPSGMNINSTLASKYFNINKDYVVVGNGAAELISGLMDCLKDKTGVIHPGFEEYTNRLDPNNIVVYEAPYPDFRYTVNDLKTYFSKHRINNLIIINPDNPSGNFIKRNDLVKLLEWASDEGIKVIVDESFIDFSEPDMRFSFLENEILAKYKNLYVIKSISKSYGVPGLRLGVLASSDTMLINRMRKKVAIWNINSFGEYYMQIYGKYENDYKNACDRFVEERRLFNKDLEDVGYLRVVPSQANYFLCEILGGFTAEELSVALLDKYGILIKDCNRKKGFPTGKQFVRFAIRDRKDNQKLVKALKALCEG